MADEKFRIKENSWLAALAARRLRSSRMAMVIGSTIHLHNCSRQQLLDNERWLRHELCHIRQYRRYGLLRFIALYLWESMRRGYYHNKFEVEARQAENL